MTDRTVQWLLFAAYTMLLLGLLMISRYAHASDLFGETLARADRQIYQNGRRVGTIAPQGEGTSRFYDDRGKSLGTMTTRGGTTTYYDDHGKVTSRLTEGRK